MARIAADVRAAIERAVDGIVHHDDEQLYNVMLGDHPINREVRALDEAAHAFVAVHLPAAASLRTVSAIMRLNIALERIGDYAVTIGRVGVQLDEEPQAWMVEALTALGRETTRMLDLAVRSFVESDAGLALRTIQLAAPIDALHNAFFHRLTTESELPAPMQVRWITVVGRLERVSDQATNVCGQTLFALTGGAKPKSQYRILFTDPEDGLTSRLALALAKRRFGDRAEFKAASWRPAAEVNPLLATLPDVLQPDLSPPTGLPNFREDLFDVVIALAPGGAAALGRLPFHAVRQTWEVDARTDLDEVMRELDTRIESLLNTLCGDEVL